MEQADVWDRLFGTRAHTPGAALQLPRKVPIRVEPKSWFANERTFLNWCSMAVTMGAAASAMLSFNRSNAPAATRTADIVTVVFTPISIALVLYALFTFYKRSRFMQHKQLGHYDDRLGPMVLASIIFVSLLTLLLKGLRDFATGTTAPPALRAWLGIAEQ